MSKLLILLSVLSTLYVFHNCYDISATIKSYFPSRRHHSFINHSARKIDGQTHNQRPILIDSKIYSTKVMSDYGADAITVLEGLEPVRKRPGMYIGSTGSKGLHHLVFEVIDNSVDEALAGHCTNITVTLKENGYVSVQDNGRGIPCSLHPLTKKSALETVLCVLHAGGKFGGDDSGYKVSGGLHGVGISVVNALSDSMHIEVIRDGSIHRMELSRGKPLTDLIIEPLSNYPDYPIARGTKVTFKPDADIFKSGVEFEYDKLAGRLDELAYLNAGLTITFIDERNGTATTAQTFRHDGGISELVKNLCQDKVHLHPEVDIISINEERKGVIVEVAMRWSKDMYTDNIVGFANGIRTIDGGSHVDGLKSAITRTVNSMAKKIGKLKDTATNIPGEFVREGLTAIINVKVQEPEFEGQTKTRLGNPEVRQIVDGVVSDSLMKIFEWNVQTLGSIVSKASDAQEAANAAKAARDMMRRKSLLHSTVLPGKLADCASRDATETEIFIVEGDSAAGSAKQGRDRRVQAILPLRGKIINVEKASSDKIYGNTEIQALISALGLGFRGSDFDAETLRYHRIIIMTDADVDGAHIRLLLLTFFYRYQKDLIHRGHIYVACPPLYKLTFSRGSKSLGNSEQYFYDQNELDSYLKTLPIDAKYQLQRFKGLGEMMPTQLWETTMDPTRRILKKVMIEDAAAADKILTLFMGDNVQPRKDFINGNADKFKLEDLDF